MFVAGTHAVGVPAVIVEIEQNVAGETFKFPGENDRPRAIISS